jgi:hypothetical protein
MVLGLDMLFLGEFEEKICKDNKQKRIPAG